MANSLTLVSFKREYFPHTKEDFNLMKSRLVTVFRIPESMLSFLQGSLLKNLKINIVSFHDVYESELEKIIQEHLEGNSAYKVDKNKLLLSYKKSNIDKVNAAYTSFNHSMGRYGFRVIRENRAHPTSPETKILSKFEVRHDPELNPSFFFGDLIPEVVEVARVHLSPSAALSFKSRPSVHNQGKTTFLVQFEDKFGKDWSTAFSRSFDLSSLDGQEVAALTNLMMSLVNHSKAYTPPKTKPTER